MIRLVPKADAPESPPVVADPRLSVRRAVRQALDGGDARALLGPLLQRHPALVDAVLEDLRISRPEAVSRLRDDLGLAQDPWDEVVERINDLDRQVSDPAERLRLAATLLIGDTENLPPSVMALCHQPSSAALVAAMHAVAHAGAQRRALEGHLVRLRRGGLHTEPGFLLNRQDSAFHEGYLEGDSLVMIFREYPDVFTVFVLQLGVGIEELIVRPISSYKALTQLLGSPDERAREHRTIEECRTQVAATIARLGDQPASQAWLALGHLVEERLFNTGAEHRGGFVVGEADARMMVDRFARIVAQEQDTLLDEMVATGSRADVSLDLYGVRYLRHLLGLSFGVSRLEVSMEESGELGGYAYVVGRTDQGQVLTRTRLELSRGADGWLIHDIQLAGVGQDDRIYRRIWERLTPGFPLPFRDYDGMSEVEQELCAGLMDEGARLDEVASAVFLSRQANLEGPIGDLAVAVHAAFEHANGRASNLRALCERYEADAVGAATLLEQLKTRLEITPEDGRYKVAE